MAGDYHLPKHLSPEAVAILRSVLDVDPETRASISALRAHAWMSGGDYDQPGGIILGVDPIPVESWILDALEKENINRRKAEEKILANRHNYTTTLYYLL